MRKSLKFNERKTFQKNNIQKTLSRNNILPFFLLLLFMNKAVKNKKILIAGILLLSIFFGVTPTKKLVAENRINNFGSFIENNYRYPFHNDSIHQLNFRYADRKRGLKPYIAPTLLITTGTALHFSTDAKQNFQNWMQNHFAYSGHVDDYIQYAPLVAVYSI